MTSEMEDRLTVQEVQGKNLWRIQMDVMREDNVWIGTAAACCDAESVPVLRAIRYGATAEDAESVAMQTLREAIAAAEGRSGEEKELR